MTQTPSSSPSLGQLAMPRLPAARDGEPLLIRDRELEFSFWPMGRSTRRYGLQSRIFASDPWNVIESVIHRDCPASARSLALAFLEQSKDFYNASQAGGIRPAKPLLIYYSFMNLVKSFVLTKGIVQSFGISHHGLTVNFPNTSSGPGGVVLRAFQATQQKANLFDLLLKGLAGAGLNATTDYALDRILPQTILGHRLWCAAAGRKERFIEIDQIEFLYDEGQRHCWLCVDLQRSEFARLGYTHSQILNGAGFQAGWRIVAAPSDLSPRLRFELTQPEAYNSRPSDVINDMVARVRHHFWRSVTIVRPFRKYYVYVADQGDSILPQLSCIYAIFFYLGSITRYRPDQFDHLVAGPYGAFIQEFIENQPSQWLYLLASEFAKQEVAKAAVV